MLRFRQVGKSINFAGIIPDERFEGEFKYSSIARRRRMITLKGLGVGNPGNCRPYQRCAAILNKA